MLIDWFTVAAQALNFLVLVWLMRRYLYKPILHAIDAREKRIAAELADAATKQAEAKKERDDYQHKNEEIDKQRQSLLTKATDEANTEKQRLLGEARKAADTMASKRLEALENDTKNLNQALTRRTQDEVFSITRKVLKDLANAELEERAVAAFTRQLCAMEGDDRSNFAISLRTSPEPALIRSAFDLPTGQREEIQKAINKTFSSVVLLSFQTVPDLVCGIELTASGNKLAWSIADYLSSLEKGVGDLIKEKAKAAPSTS